MTTTTTSLTALLMPHAAIERFLSGETVALPDKILEGNEPVASKGKTYQPKDGKITIPGETVDAAPELIRLQKEVKAQSAFTVRLDTSSDGNARMAVSGALAQLQAASRDDHDRFHALVEKAFASDAGGAFLEDVARRCAEGLSCAQAVAAAWSQVDYNANREAYAKKADEALLR